MYGKLIILTEVVYERLNTKVSLSVISLGLLVGIILAMKALITAITRTSEPPLPGYTPKFPQDRAWQVTGERQTAQRFCLSRAHCYTRASQLCHFWIQVQNWIAMRRNESDKPELTVAKSARQTSNPPVRSVMSLRLENKYIYKTEDDLSHVESPRKSANRELCRQRTPAEIKLLPEKNLEMRAL
ncbi:hypothetical protein Tco_0817028 [Tanacetum coccineum]